MGKIDEFEFRGMPQEVIDFKDKVTEIINYGKFQKQSVRSFPGWRGREGEEVYYYAGNSWALLMCSSDMSTTWKVVATFS
jgi:hypothetical protein